MNNARFGRRLAGLLIDLPLSIILATVIGNALSSIWRDEREPQSTPHVTQIEDFFPWPIVIAAFAAFLTPFWFRSFSLGAWLLGLRTTAQDSGNRPSLIRAYLRALLTSVSIIATLMLVGGGFSDFSAEVNTLDYAAFASSGILSAASLLAYFYSFIDAEHRTLQDRLTGLVVFKIPRGNRASSSVATDLNRLDEGQDSNGAVIASEES